MSRWNDARFRIERSMVGAMALRRLRPNPADAARGTILYVHGLGESALCFETSMSDPRLAAYDHVAPDLVGYGKSAWADEPADLEGHAADLENLLERLGLGSVVVLGHSMGGVVGLHLAERCPERVDALVNVEGNASPPDCLFSGQAARWSRGDWLAHGRAAFLDALHAKAGDGDAHEDPWVIRAYAASIEMADPRAYHRNSGDLVRESATGTIARRLAALPMPQIYVHGLPRGIGEPTLGLLEDAGVPLRPLAVAGHWPFLDQHDAFVDAFLDFLETR